MKNYKKLLSLICACVLSFNFLTVISVAGGTGTEADPYIITTADELQNINNNVTSHYILGNDIDLADIDFTPIGNADSGAFSGSFDGNGYTIYNLDVCSGKYAGLFGSNEGTIKNVILEEIYVYGSRYLGGIVGQNTALGAIESCKVISGLVETDGGISDIYIGGICGINEGAFEGIFSNGANITVNAPNNSCYAGGIIGYNNYGLNLNASNTGNIIGDAAYSRSGGLVGRADGMTIIINNSCNTGNITSENASGGLVGRADGTTIIINNSYNTGDISVSTAVAYSGGFVAQAEDTTITINNSYNTGNISSGYYLGGLVGFANSTVTINGCYNTGDISSEESHSSAELSSGGLIGYVKSEVTINRSYNTGYISSFYNSGGLVGCVRSTLFINDSYNTGNISGLSKTYAYSGGLVGKATGTTLVIKNSYNTGNIFSDDYGSYSGNLVGEKNWNTTTNCISSYSIKGSVVKCCGLRGVSGVGLSWSDMKNISSYIDWDFDEVWTIDSNINNGYPVLKVTASPLSLNISNKVMLSGSTIQLTAYKNGVATNDVTWSVSSGSATVSSTGLVTAGEGLSTITATDSEGNKANFNTYIITKATSLTATDRTINLSESNVSDLSYFTVNNSDTDYVVNYQSNDISVLNVDSWGRLTPVKVGKATITATTAGGVSATQIVTVTDVATGISLPPTLTVTRDSTQKISATTSPSPTSSVITWKSSDESVATVDSEGNVTGLKSGTTIITATTDNGYSSTCTVTVNAPITEMAFETPSLTLYTGETYKLKLNIEPTDTTDIITYSTSSSTYASVTSAGKVNAKKTGTVTITATSSSGQKAYCNITIKSWPSVLTTVDSTTTIINRYIVTDADLTTKIKDLVVAKDGYSVTATPSHSAGAKSYFGTGSTVDVYDEYGNLVITYTVVVNGDTNGDSVCDALDAWQVSLASNDHTALEGAYDTAADLNSDNAIDITDYQSIVNKAVS